MVYISLIVKVKNCIYTSFHCGSQFALITKLRPETSFTRNEIILLLVCFFVLFCFVFFHKFHTSNTPPKKDNIYHQERVVEIQFRQLIILGN